MKQHPIDMRVVGEPNAWCVKKIVDLLDCWVHDSAQRVMDDMRLDRGEMAEGMLMQIAAAIQQAVMALGESRAPRPEYLDAFLRVHRAYVEKALKK